MSQELFAVSPLDGRYKKSTDCLSNYFSEFALFRYRVKVEVEYFAALCALAKKPENLSISSMAVLKATNVDHIDKLRDVCVNNFSLADAEWIKNKEKETNHDIKAVEYYIKSKMQDVGLGDCLEFIHFALTSQDINNTSIPMLLKDAVEKEYIPKLEDIITLLKSKQVEWNYPMLAHTHGQPASPTNLAKEFKVWIERLEVQLNQLRNIPFTAKFGGVTGNFNAHLVAYPSVNWRTFADNFVRDSLQLTSRQQYTTQIEHYDNIAALCDNLKRINNILLDLSKDVWQYIALNYFQQEIKTGEVGSSAMPHKVNPIDFENAEGNMGLGNALFEHLAAKLPISRLQRDLTDSTVLRNLGVPFGYSFVAFSSLKRGILKLIVNKQAIAKDLENNWAIVAEGIQTVLRREGYPSPYEALKALTRTNEAITKESITTFIANLDGISDQTRSELYAITPSSYTGYA
eukprot:Tbor_TRINITY_DN5472_c0_g2::TRINITY_DN5472_c0_g2_i11::g.24511::m.24511/K01756/purB, ADSL; adenylosuccinate lyase